MKNTKQIRHAKKILFYLFFIFGPILVCLLSLFNFISYSIYDIDPTDVYKIITASIAITTTLSSLSLNLSKKDKTNTKMYFKSGEFFFFAVILLVMALIIKYTETTIINGSILNKLLISYLRILLILFYFFGVGLFCYALSIVYCFFTNRIFR